MDQPEKLPKARGEPQERESVNQAIRRGLADFEAGRHQPADEVMAEIRKEFGFDRKP
jgi:predicted transcriptional regulator